MQPETCSVGARVYVSQNLQKNREFRDPQVIFFEIHLSGGIREAAEVSRIYALSFLPWMNTRSKMCFNCGIFLLKHNT